MAYVQGILIQIQVIVSAVSSDSEPDIPQSLLLDLRMSYLSHQWMKILCDDESVSSGLVPHPEHLIPAFESQVEQFRHRASASVWPSYMEAMFRGMRLQAYSFIVNSKSSEADLYRGKALSEIIDLVAAARNDATSLGYWPVFTRYRVVFAASVGIYIAARTDDNTSRASLLRACKDAVNILFSCKFSAEHTRQSARLRAIGQATCRLLIHNRSWSIATHHW